LLTAVLARQAAAAVGVRTCWPWELLRCRLLGGASASASMGRERGGAYRGGVSTVMKLRFNWILEQND